MLKEIRKQIKDVEQAIEERQKRVNVLTESSSVEAIIEKSRLETEIGILNKKLSELRDGYGKIKEDFQKRLPELEKQYLEEAGKQEKIFTDVKELIDQLEKTLESLIKNINETRLSYIPLKNLKDDLGLSLEGKHLEGIPEGLTRIIQGIRMFKDWMKSTGRL